MGFSGISLWQLLIVLVIVVLIFGTKRLTSLGSDLGGAVKGFRKAMGDAEKEEDAAQLDKPDAEFSESSTSESQSESESRNS